MHQLFSEPFPWVWSYARFSGSFRKLTNPAVMGLRHTHPKANTYTHVNTHTHTHTHTHTR